MKYKNVGTASTKVSNINIYYLIIFFLEQTRLGSALNLLLNFEFLHGATT